MRFLALLLLLINVLAFAYWHMFDPPPPPEQVYISSYLPEGVKPLQLLSETDKPMAAALLAENHAATPVTTSTASIEPPPSPTPAPESEAAAPVDTASTTEEAQPVEPLVAVAEVLDTQFSDENTNTPADTVDTPETQDNSSQMLSDVETEALLAAIQGLPVPPEKSEKNETQPSAAPDTAQPLVKGQRLSDTVARSFSRLGQFRMTKVKKLDSKTLLAANMPERQFLSSTPLASPDAPAAQPQVIQGLPSTQFQPIQHGSSILQVPSAIAQLNTRTSSLASAPSTAKTLSALAAHPVTLPLTALKPKPTAAKLSTAPSITPSPQQKTTTTPSSRSHSQKTVCFRTGIFKQRSTAEKALQWLQNRGVKATLKTHGQQEKTGTWLYLPPFRNRTLARQAEQELARRGVRDYYLMTKAPWNNAISLGVFSTESNATRRLAELKQRGYYNVRVQHRYKGDNSYKLDLRLLEKSKDTLKSFANAFKVLTPRPINCQ